MLTRHRVALGLRAATLATLFGLILTTTSSASTISTEAKLRGRVASLVDGEAHPIRYSVNFHSTFGSISEVDYLFTFADSNPLNPGECLALTTSEPFFGGGFCNSGTTPITSRLMTFPASVGFDLSQFLDGTDQGEIFAQLPPDVPVVNTSFHLKSLTVTIHQ
jgi:hypothetical protein